MPLLLFKLHARRVRNKNTVHAFEKCVAWKIRKHARTTPLPKYKLKMPSGTKHTMKEICMGKHTHVQGPLGSLEGLQPDGSGVCKVLLGTFCCLAKGRRSIRGGDSLFHFRRTWG